VASLRGGAADAKVESVSVLFLSVCICVCVRHYHGICTGLSHVSTQQWRDQGAFADNLGGWWADGRHCASY
jgi:hypothetical protein